MYLQNNGFVAKPLTALAPVGAEKRDLVLDPRCPNVDFLPSTTKPVVLEAHSNFYAGLYHKNLHECWKWLAMVWFL